MTTPSTASGSNVPMLPGRDDNFVIRLTRNNELGTFSEKWTKSSHIYPSCMTVDDHYKLA
jgi:hypothetical protein